ncbi:MAG: hypothetical protein M5U26_27080 [Planctomycetota bacterium]|nr:hypothetical protein [Planctomycetota bacterium]
MAGDRALPSLPRSVVLGALGFGAASVAVFATVAFGERWMYRTLGHLGAYAAWTALFIVLGGAALAPLLAGPRRLLRSYLLFGGSFLAYAGTWVGAYFSLHGAAGEWVGSAVGSALMALVLAGGFKSWRTLPRVAPVLFASNALGYFLGGMPFYALKSPAGMLLWGVIYGLFLGAGLGASFHLAQVQRSRPSEA